ncbi:RNA polymerase sigma factor [Myxococcus sp. K15C18031901]|uniref:RNA polymerase sigma factor n=1 Tax=Myxococcus dinghuensis TaxID=2906761 RepID=UPI0020A77C40|nr:RNA polymerase sigma factor [Myxococcus dinghuensis]MCP3099896.1 RNA polymerase sigma factor [Myxococcus dinghuensis]
MMLDRLRPRLRARARRMLGPDSPEVEEVVQDTIVRFLLATRNRPKSWASEEECANYLSAVLSSCVIDHFRRAKLRRGGESELSNVVSIREQLSPHEPPGVTGESFLRAMAELTDGQRTAFSLLCEGGLSYRQIAQRLKTSPEAVAKRICEARGALAQKLGYRD